MVSFYQRPRPESGTYGKKIRKRNSGRRIAPAAAVYGRPLIIEIVAGGHARLESQVRKIGFKDLDKQIVGLAPKSV